MTNLPSDPTPAPRSSDVCNNIRCRHPRSYHGAEQGHGRHCAGTHMDPSDDSLPYYCDCKAFTAAPSVSSSAPPDSHVCHPDCTHPSHPKPKTDAQAGPELIRTTPRASSAEPAPPTDEYKVRDAEKRVRLEGMVRYPKIRSLVDAAIRSNGSKKELLDALHVIRRELP